MKDEQKFYQFLRKKLSGADLQRIETTTGSGVPDVNAICRSVETWLELKVVLPRGILLRPEQYAWGMRRAKHGGKCMVLAWDKDNDIVLIHLFPFITIEAISSKKYLKIVSTPHTFLGCKDEEWLYRSLIFDIP